MKRHQSKTFFEYGFLFVGEKDDDYGNVAISQKVFNELERFILANSEVSEFLKLGVKKGYGKTLSAQNYVGVIQTKSDFTIEILPKITKESSASEACLLLVKMLRTLKKSPFKHTNKAHLQTMKMPLFEVFITMFLDELAVLAQKGLKREYIAYEENLRFFKGKLKFANHLRQNALHKERFFVAYDTFSVDRVENRLIKSTLRYLYSRSISFANQRRIREFLFLFDEVSYAKNIKTDFQKLQNTRDMRHYEQTLLWCKTFLLGESFSPYKGESVAFALLFDMNKLFEDYVFAFLKKYYRFDSITAQDTTHHLAKYKHKKIFGLRPDIVAKKYNTIFVLDTKYKILSNEKNNLGVAQSDAYQLYAYAKKYNANDVFLIYPKKEGIKAKRFALEWQEEATVNLNIVLFDLEKSLQGALRDEVCVLVDGEDLV